MKLLAFTFGKATIPSSDTAQFGGIVEYADCILAEE